MADLLLPPVWANLATLMVYSARWGLRAATGCFGTLRVGRAVAGVGAIVFIHSSWFGLHFAEGHIAFGTMQLLPLSMYLAMTANQRRNLSHWGCSKPYFLLDGSIYTFVYSLLAILTAIAFGMVRAKVLKETFSKNPQQLVLLRHRHDVARDAQSVAGDLGRGRSNPRNRHLRDAFSLVTRSLFNPFETVHSSLPPDAHTRFEILEFNCYLSVFGLAGYRGRGASPAALLAAAWPYLLGALVWFWVGSGWPPNWNPWHLIQHVPLVNNVHVQSRLFSDVHFLRHPFRKGAPTSPAPTRLFWVVSAVLVVESLVVRNFPMTDQVVQTEPAPDQLIDHKGFTNTVAWAYMPSHYFSGQGSRECYEPSFYPSNIKIPAYGNYQGEAYPVDKDAGTALISQYTPGHIALSYDLKRPTRIELNSNALNGWRVDPAAGKLYGSGGDLLQFEPKNLSGVLISGIGRRICPGF